MPHTSNTLQNSLAGISWVNIKSLNSFLLLLSICIASFFCFYNLGQYSFGEGDQSTHSLVAQDMVHTGNLLQPTVVDKPYFNKPPLKIWAVSLIVKIFGESNLTYRVLDGFLGVGMVIAVYLLAYKLFQNPLLSFFSILNLLACRLFLFSHGTRVATQDSAQVFFFILALFPLLNFIKNRNEIKISSDSESELTQSAKDLQLIGLYSGIGMLCKGLGALIIAPIMLACALLVPSPLKQLKKYYKSILGLVACIFIPLLFVASLYGTRGDNFLKMLFLTEGFKRATKGFHYVNHKWYYFNSIFKHGMVVPPYLLIIGLAIALYYWLVRKRFEYGFVVILAVVPILFYQMMKSKLPWYIFPSFPGLSILSAIAIVSLLEFTIASRKKNVLFCSVAGLLSLYGLYSMEIKLQDNLQSIVTEYPEYPLSSLAHDLENVEQAPSLALYKISKFAKNDNLYLRMLNSDYSPSKSQIQIEDFKKTTPHVLIISSLRHAPELTAIVKPRGYMLMPFYGRRRKPAIALWYKKEGELPDSVKPWCNSIQLSSRSLQLNKGWAFTPAKINGVPFRSTRGSYSSMMIEGDGLMALYKNSIKINLAATALGASSPKNRIRISLNDTETLNIDAPKEGFNYYSGNIPAGTIQIGPNLLSIRQMMDASKKTEITPQTELSFISDIEICPE